MFYSFSAGIDFRRQNLTSKVDPLTERVNTNHAMYNMYNKCELCDQLGKYMWPIQCEKKTI